MLEIKNFSKIYGGKFKAVDNLSIEVKNGEIYGFIGHNGAGKSTTIKAVVGALAFEEGEILIGGKSIKKDPVEAKKLIAYIPDNPDIYDFMTGIQYLNFVGDVFGVSDEDRNARIKKYADTFEIAKNLGDPIASYSHGMCQKLVIISALLHAPKLLVMDEPFVGLDPVAAFRLKEIMRELCNEGCAVFFSTHVLEVAEKLCDRVGIIKGGKLVVEGDMKDIVGDTSLENIFLELQGENVNRTDDSAKDEING
ncbi:MAG: ABC transporter ATP-binding protein [Clostridia bacterium]|nr:ABC transporter ATP-binding protein [Clostridia bacterium]